MNYRAIIVIEEQLLSFQLRNLQISYSFVDFSFNCGSIFAHQREDSIIRYVDFFIGCVQLQNKEEIYDLCSCKYYFINKKHRAHIYEKSTSLFYVCFLCKYPERMQKLIYRRVLLLNPTFRCSIVPHIWKNNISRNILFGNSIWIKGIINITCFFIAFCNFFYNPQKKIHFRISQIFIVPLLNLDAGDFSFNK